MKKSVLRLKKNAPLILTVTGSLGVIGTAVLAAKATPKAMLLMEEAKKEKGEELTKTEIVKACWRPYIPSIVTGATTIGCIFGANYLNGKQQKTLLSAYALLHKSYDEYRNRVVLDNGKECDTNIISSIAANRLEYEGNVEDEQLIFFDYYSMRYYTATMDDVMYAENAFLDLLHQKGYAAINEYYNLLNSRGVTSLDPDNPIGPVEFGYDLGWFDVENNDPYDCRELEFEYETTTTKDGRTICAVSTNTMPTSYSRCIVDSYLQY